MASRHNCPRCQRHVEACECGDPVTQAERQAGMLPMSLSVNSDETPIGFGGYDRPPEHIENIDEIAARFRENDRPLLVCSYCSETARTRDITEAFQWFNSHVCSGEGVPIAQWLAA